MGGGYSAAAYARTPVPTPRELHVMRRLGTGFSTTLLKQVRAAGGEQAWTAGQLDPASVPESAKAAAVDGWFPRLADPPAEVWRRDQDGSYKAWEYARDLCNAAIQRRVYSNRSLHEVMVEFWSNHLHVNATHFPAFTQRAAYDRVLREHALGTFEDLLVAATLHPAMLLYLDNWKSVRNAPNENHGRELLELHTVGREAGYTEAMVRDSAVILSGYTVVRDTWQGSYDPGRHTTGAVRVLGFSDPNGTADGADLAVRYLRYLARHEATARRICRKLAVRFVSDDPPDALVDRLASVYLSSGTDIAAVLRELVASEAFWASAGQKVRTPVEDVVATAKALGVKAKAPTDLSSYVHDMCWAIGATLEFQWPRPDGPPDVAGPWSSPTRMLNSWQMHWGLAGGWWPSGQASFRKARWYLPQKRIRFDAYVDHVCRRVLGQPSTDRLLQAACQGCDIAPDERVTRRHPVMTWKHYRLLAVLLDAPEHMMR